MNWYQLNIIIVIFVLIKGSYSLPVYPNNVTAAYCALTNSIEILRIVYFGDIVEECAKENVSSIVCDSTIKRCGIEGQVNFTNNFTSIEAASGPDNDTLKRFIPTEIGYLTDLISIDLFNLPINGTVPTEIGNLYKLENLNLTLNSLEGTIPTQIENLQMLTILDLSLNLISGTIPQKLMDMHLQVLYLGATFLSGTIPGPSAPGTLQEFDASSNNLEGTIPTTFAMYPQLDFLWLSFNNLNGTIPSELGSLTFLTRLSLSNNGLMGTIPSELGNAVSLQMLDLSGNNLQGSIPGELGNLTLQSFDVTNNQITGIQMGDYNIGVFTLKDNMINQLANDVFSSLFPITGSGNIGKLDLSNNLIGGELSISQNFSNSLTYLDISRNLLVGSIDNFMNGFPKLQTLMLLDNMLTGSLPQVLPPSLITLNMSHSNLYGSFPPSLPVNLTLLDVSHNNLNGTLPNTLPLGLTVFYVNDNIELTGTLPQNLGNLTHLGKIDLSNTNLCGSFPSEWDGKFWDHCNIDILHNCGTDKIREECIFNRTCDPNMLCFVNQCEMKNSHCDNRECHYKEPWSYDCGDCQYAPYIYQNDGDYHCAISWIIIVVPVAFVLLVVIVIIICCKCCRKSKDYSSLK